MAETEWELRIDQMVRENLHTWWQVYADPDGPEVHRMTSGTKFWLHFGVQNQGTEVHFEEIEIRLVPLYNQISFLDQNNQPAGRTHLMIKDLASAGQPHDTERVGAYFVANRDINRPANPFLTVGVYAQVRPEGHFWRTHQWR